MPIVLSRGVDSCRSEGVPCYGVFLIDYDKKRKLEDKNKVTKIKKNKKTKDK